MILLIKRPNIAPKIMLVKRCILKPRIKASLLSLTPKYIPLAIDKISASIPIINPVNAKNNSMAKPPIKPEIELRSTILIVNCFVMVIII